MTFWQQKPWDDWCWPPCKYWPVQKCWDDCKKPWDSWGECRSRSLWGQGPSLGSRSWYPYSCYTRKYSFGSCYPCQVKPE